MGKGQIISETGEGLYTIQVKHDTTAAQARLDKIDGIIAGVEAEIAAVELLIAAAEVDALAALNTKKTLLESRITPLEKEKERIESALDLDYDVSAWCADLTTGLTGEVGTIEPAAEYKNGVNIQPGGAAHSDLTDGNRNAFSTLSVADAMRNFAIMPGVQKYCPTFRYGTISNIDKDADLCRVDYEPTLSGIQNLDVNLYTYSTGVPVEYMTCNAGAFSDGDSVIVEFEGNDWNAPKVIGFKSNPKPCESLHLKLASINGITSWLSGQFKFQLTQPIPSTVTHWKKGTYTEDFKIVATGNVDSAHVAKMTLEPGVEIDPAYPLHARLRNGDIWRYYTTDWKGAMPDQGIKQYWVGDDVGGGNNSWQSYPDPAGDYDYLVDSIYYVLHDVDLRGEAAVAFTAADGEPLTGYSIDITNVKMIRHHYYKYSITDVSCNWGYGEVIPHNTLETKDRIKYTVEPDFDIDRFYYTYIDIVSRWCGMDKITFTCPGGDSGLAAKYIGSTDYGTGPKYWAHEPCILTDREGRNPVFNKSERSLNLDSEVIAQYIAIEDVEGDPFDCLASAYNAGTPEFYSWQIGEGIEWTMVDVTDIYQVI